jgi:hypothetical protein
MRVPEPWAIYEELQGRDPSILSNAQRLVQAFGEVREEVNSGGFDRYLRYSDRRNAPIAAEAARTAGCPELADLIDEAVALAGSELLAAERDVAVADRLEQVEDDLERLDQRFYDLELTADLDAGLSRLVARLS